MGAKTSGFIIGDNMSLVFSTPSFTIMSSLLFEMLLHPHIFVLIVIVSLLTHYFFKVKGAKKRLNYKLY